MSKPTPKPITNTVAVIPDILGVIECTDRVLWASYEASTTVGSLTEGARFLFPKYKDGSKKKLRVSEQESRFAFVAELSKTPLVYSIETPTALTYRQKGVGERSAETDLTVYQPSKRAVLNVEFKAGGISTRRQSAFVIAKDLEKLLREQPDGLWFHTVEAVNNSTLTELWSVFCRELSLVARKYRDSIATKQVLFHVCVLRQKFAIQLEIAIEPECIDSKWSLSTTCLGYRVSRKGLLATTQTNDWQVIR